MPLQDWVHHWAEGGGARLVKIVAGILAFVALAAIYDRFTIYSLTGYEDYSSEEAMETAQLARHIAAGRGYTTDSIRPLALYLLTTAAPPGQSSQLLAQPIADITTPPVYPYLLAGLMKVIPFNFQAKEFWFYQPERWISLFNQVLFFCATVLLFALTRKLFDAKVAWLAAILFAGTNLFWRLSVSGLSTIWLILVFLAIVSCMTALERAGRANAEGAGYKWLPLAFFTGALVGLGGLTRYAFAWMIIPVATFIGMSISRGRVKLTLAVLAGFVAVMAPWVARNVQVSGQPFGTAAFSLVAGTPQFPGDTLERSNNPRGGLRRMETVDVVNKILANARELLLNDLPKMGGSWIAAFFLASLLLPFRDPGLARLRWFIAGSIILLFVVQAAGRTHLSEDSPQINSENLLTLLAPLVFVYGAALFYTLLEQHNLSPFDAQGMAVGTFVLILCLPCVLALVAPAHRSANSPYSPKHIQQTASLLQTNETMMSDIPSGVAWYGDRPCLWLSLDDQEEFFTANAFKPVAGLFLTQITTDKRFLSQMKDEPNGWGHFVLECSEHGEVPTGFPLRKAPVGLLPAQLFLSDRDRWNGR
jgi:cbb3-type cytochrome oxidase subunit 3